MDVPASSRPGYTIASLCVLVLLVLNVVLGGSVGATFPATAALEVIASLMLIWCLFDAGLRPLGRPALLLLGTAGFLILFCVLQLVPLPHAWWAALPGRAIVSEAFAVTGLGQVDQPLSLAPQETLYGLLRFLPPVAIFILIARTPWTALTASLAWTIVLLAVLSATIGLAQIYIKEAPQLFFYGQGDRLQAAGLFQVVNHQATLQLMAIPFIAVLFERLKSQVDRGDTYHAHAHAIAVAAALALVVAGVVLSGTIAGYAMIIPVAVASCLLVVERKPSVQLIGIGIVSFAGLCVLTFVVLTSPMLGELGIKLLGEGPAPSRDAYGSALEMARDYFPWGAGLGAFEGAYPGYASLSTAIANDISHVQSGFLEIAVELGAPGCVAVAAAAIWWSALTVQAWRATPEEGGRLKRAASVSVAVVLIHSLVDFPARTEAISCLAALCMGLVATSPGEKQPKKGREINRQHGAFMHRHVEI